jgi:hypothetical protein
MVEHHRGENSDKTVYRSCCNGVLEKLEGLPGYRNCFIKNSAPIKLALPFSDGPFAMEPEAVLEPVQAYIPWSLDMNH